MVMPPVFGKESRLSKHVVWAPPVEMPVFIGKYREVGNKDNNAGYDLNVIEKVKETIRKSKKRLINGHEFELRFMTDNKNSANREARKYRKRGFHTRVMKQPSGVFSVYRRPKIVG